MDFIIVVLLIYLIWSTESNAKVIVSNQKEIGKEIELLNCSKDAEQIGKEV